MFEGCVGVIVVVVLLVEDSKSFKFDLDSNGECRCLLDDWVIEEVDLCVVVILKVDIMV